MSLMLHVRPRILHTYSAQSGNVQREDLCHNQAINKLSLNLGSSAHDFTCKIMCAAAKVLSVLRRN